MLENYKNEYVFKNLIAQEILIKKHWLKTSTLFTELRVVKSKVDIVIFNGSSYAYEIKTEFDNFNKLIKQLNDYEKVFEYINVVTPETRLQCLEKTLQKYDKNIYNKIGIFVLTKKKTLSEVKQAQSNFDNIDNVYLFRLLHKIEYLRILKKHFNIPQVPNTQIYEICKKMFMQLPKQYAYKEVVKAIKQRKSLINLVDNIKKMPNFIKIAVIDRNLNTLKQEIFLSTIEKKI